MAFVLPFVADALLKKKNALPIVADVLPLVADVAAGLVGGVGGQAVTAGLLDGVGGAMRGLVNILPIPPNIKPGAKCKPPAGKLGKQRAKRRIKVYHATSKKNVKSILKNGMKASQKGRLGKAVYFTSKFSEASAIAQSAWSQGNGQVICAEIETDGHIFNAGFDSKPGADWKWPMDVVKSKHPAWPGAGLSSPFTEIAVRNPSRIKNLQVM